MAFTRSLSQALVDKGIRVNGVAPGPIWTPLIPASFDAEKVARARRERADGARRPAATKSRPATCSSPARTVSMSRPGAPSERRNDRERLTRSERLPPQGLLIPAGNSGRGLNVSPATICTDQSRRAACRPFTPRRPPACAGARSSKGSPQHMPSTTSLSLAPSSPARVPSGGQACAAVFSRTDAGPTKIRACAS